MYKRCKSLFLILSFAAIGISYNALAKTALIINNSRLPVTVMHTECNPESHSCTIATPAIIATRTTGQNSLEIFYRALNTFSIFNAIEQDTNGNIVAKADHACNLPTDAGVIILDDYGTSHIVCTYAE